MATTSIFEGMLQNLMGQTGLGPAPFNAAAPRRMSATPRIAAPQGRTQPLEAPAPPQMGPGPAEAFAGGMGEARLRGGASSENGPDGSTLDRLLPRLMGSASIPPAAMARGPERPQTAAAGAPRDPGAGLNSPSFFASTPGQPAQPVDYVDISSRSKYAAGARPMKRVDGLVVHHTGGRGDAAGVVNTLNQRGLSVQYVIDRDGKIYRTMPEGARANHIKPPNSPMRAGKKMQEKLGDRYDRISQLSNSNVLGVEIIALDDTDILPVQVEAARRLAADTQARYGFPPENVLGHGEFQKDKQSTEGQTVVTSITGKPPWTTAQTNEDPFGVKAFQKERETAILQGDPELDKLAGVMLAEARGEGERGMIGVGQVAANRVADQSGRFPNSYGEVLNGEFAAPMSYANRAKDGVSDEQWAQARKLAAGVMSGEIRDPEVGQSLYFMNPKTASAKGAQMIRDSGVELATINNHVFYGPARGADDAAAAATEMAGGPAPGIPGSASAFAGEEGTDTLAGGNQPPPPRLRPSTEPRRGQAQRGEEGDRRETLAGRPSAQDVLDRGPRLRPSNVAAGENREGDGFRIDVRPGTELPDETMEALTGIVDIVNASGDGQKAFYNALDGAMGEDRTGKRKRDEKGGEGGQKNPAIDRPTVRRGNKGEAVRALQSEIYQKMPPGVLDGDFVDGDFGPETEAAVRHIQEQARIANPEVTVDGVVGPQTWGILDSRSPYEAEGIPTPRARPDPESAMRSQASAADNLAPPSIGPKPPRLSRAGAGDNQAPPHIGPGGIIHGQMSDARRAIALAERDAMRERSKNAAAPLAGPRPNLGMRPPAPPAPPAPRMPSTAADMAALPRGMNGARFPQSGFQKVLGAVLPQENLLTDLGIMDQPVQKGSPPRAGYSTDSMRGSPDNAFKALMDAVLPSSTTINSPSSTPRLTPAAQAAQAMQSREASMAGPPSLSTGSGDGTGTIPGAPGTYYDPSTGTWQQTTYSTGGTF